MESERQISQEHSRRDNEHLKKIKSIWFSCVNNMEGGETKIVVVNWCSLILSIISLSIGINKIKKKIKFSIDQCKRNKLL